MISNIKVDKNRQNSIMNLLYTSPNPTAIHPRLILCYFYLNLSLNQARPSDSHTSEIYYWPVDCFHQITHRHDYNFGMPCWTLKVTPRKKLLCPAYIFMLRKLSSPPHPRAHYWDVCTSPQLLLLGLPCEYYESYNWSFFIKILWWVV